VDLGARNPSQIAKTGPGGDLILDEKVHGEIKIPLATLEV
jgi:hypothetical protein